jgi:hypothetical protein
VRYTKQSPNAAPGTRSEENIRVAYDKYVTNPWIFTCPYLKIFGIKTAPHDFGYFSDPKWYDKYYANAGGGWAGKDRSGNPPVYTMIPFSWFANYSPNDNPIDWQAGVSSYPREPKWPRVAADCSSRGAMVSHAIVYKTSAGRGSGYDDFGHGGSIMRIKKFVATKGLDNSVGYGDGHLETVLKSKMRWRVQYNTAWDSQVVVY